MKKLRNGCTEVRLQLSPELMDFARERWRALGHADVQDYLNTLLNTALFQDECRAEQEEHDPDALAAARTWPDDLEPVF